MLSSESGRPPSRPDALEGTIRIAQVVPGSIAADLELEAGSRIVRINGAVVRDSVDFRYLEAEEALQLEVAPAAGGDVVVYEIEKEAHEPLGIVPAADPVRQCANRCVFCFVDGNPAGARRSLHLKDDDFRLSFTYGSYVTLTNLGPKGFARIVEQRLSPLYVSVHATEPEVRERLLGADTGGDILERLRRLLDGGIQVHTQVVLCPEWNDGIHLERTVEDLWALGPGVLSLSVVPVGLTRYNLGRPVRLLTADEAVRAIRATERARERALSERGLGWAYVGDEMFFLAGWPLPPAAYYDDWPLTENGVGAVRRLLDDFETGIAGVPRLDGRRIAIVTGQRMGPVLAPLAERLGGATGGEFRVLAVENGFFGETVTTAGLLAGLDILQALQAAGPFDAALLPAEALNDDGVFVDDLPLGRLAGALPSMRLVPAFELTSALDEL